MSLKNRLFLPILLIAFSGTISGMDYSEIAQQRLDAQIAKDFSYALSLDHCLSCGDLEPQLSCSKCLGVSYCSRSCYVDYAKYHAKNCDRIARAQKGDLKSLQSFYQAWLRVAKETKKLEHIRKAHDSALRFVVVFQLKRYCTLSPETFAKYFKHIDSGDFKQIIDLLAEQLDPNAVDNESRNASARVLNWAKDLVNSDTMICPGDILDYSEVPEVKLCPANEWLGWRASVLKYLIEEEEAKQKQLSKKLKNEN